MTPETRVYTAKSGDEYRFLFNHRGLIAAERASNPLTGLGALMQGLAEGSLHAIVSLIKGGLTVHHPELTFDEAWDLWRVEKQAIVKAMAEALESAMPLVADMLGVPLRPRKGAAKAPAPPRGTGTRSSGRGSKQG
jgi:hypothetical protein